MGRKCIYLEKKKKGGGRAGSGGAGRGGAAAAVSPPAPASAPPPPHLVYYHLSFKSPHQITIFRVSESMQKGLYSTDYSVRRRLTVMCVRLGTLENPKHSDKKGIRSTGNWSDIYTYINS